MEKVSYALGLSIGNNLIGSDITGVNLDKFVQGVQDVLEQKTAEISYDEAKIVLDEYFQDLANKMQALNKQIGVDYLKKLATLLNASFDDSYTDWKLCVKRNGKYLSVVEYLDKKEDWKKLIIDTLEKTNNHGIRSKQNTITV